MTTYREAGVDIAAGEATVERIKPLVRETFTPGVLTDIGAFGGFFALDPGDFRQPVLVSSMDGVGTKLQVAVLADRHDTIGQDLVNHCVNDIAVCGARPLFFLDYLSTGRLEPDVAVQIVRGFAQACRENGCALIGGETAEMPGLYRDGDYDIAGCIVGVVERDEILDGSRVREGDVLVALPSNGLHTNGYSLARKVLFEHFAITDAPEVLNGRTLADELLRVHRSYLEPVQALMRAGLASAFSHITGGGLVANTERVVPAGLSVEVDWGSWDIPHIFAIIQRLGMVPEEDMRRTFNLGAGLVAIVPRDRQGEAESLLRELGEAPFVVGRIAAA
jgi:phosphoribosylformylglycinamidine cyclo-ligase